MNCSSESDEVRESDKHVLSKNKIDVVELAGTNSGSDEFDLKKNSFKRINKKQVMPYIFIISIM